MSFGEYRQLCRKEREGTLTPEELALLDEWRHVGKRMNATIPPRVLATVKRRIEALEVHDQLAALASRPAPRAPHARAPRARRVTRARRAPAGDDAPSPRPLDLLDAALLGAGWERVE